MDSEQVRVEQVFADGDEDRVAVAFGEGDRNLDSDLAGIFTVEGSELEDAGDLDPAIGGLLVEVDGKGCSGLVKGAGGCP